MSDISQQAKKTNSLSNRSRKQIKQSSILCTTKEDDQITPITAVQANIIIRSEVEAMVARGGSPETERFHDPFVRVALI